MELPKEFWEKWTKHHVPYKIDIYMCGCSYVFIADPDRRTLTKHCFCPVHKVGKKYTILWCEVCGLKIKTKPKAGHRQKRCYDCGKAFLLEYNRINFKLKYAKKFNKRQRIKKKTELQEFNEENITYKDVAYLALARAIKSMKVDLPVVETPILDKYLKEKRNGTIL